MARKWVLSALTITGMLFCLLGHTVPAAAQEPTPENDENCVSCHTHRYYLYDSGKYFCLCEAPMHCIYCHSGRTDSMDKDLAHEGLVLYPTRDQAERCQACHTEDYLDRVVTFGAVAGIRPTPQPIPTATERAAAAVIPAQPPQVFLRLSQLEPWQIAGLAVSTLALLMSIVFGFRCYKQDCLLRARDR